MNYSLNMMQSTPPHPQYHAGIEPRALCGLGKRSASELVLAPELEELPPPLSPIFGKLVGFSLPSRLGERKLVLNHGNYFVLSF